MKEILNLKEMQAFSDSLRGKGRRIGFVPTMGFLHEGHISLIKEASRHSDQVIVSIFVNPLQFGPKEDFEKYPRDPEGDSLKCQEGGADLLFLPKRGEIVGEGTRTFVTIEKIMERLCGASRPGHFQGVATIVLKLLHLVQPHLLFLGEKDFQQTVILKKMIRDFFMPVQVEVIPTVRETDGLAMSSRNSYLTPEERKSATVLHRAMKIGEEEFRQGETQASKLKTLMLEAIMKEGGAKLDYLEIVDPELLDPIEQVTSEARIVLAVWIGKTRLIDNLALLPIRK
jgi:pantoate--beta-alanine ligase